MPLNDGSEIAELHESNAFEIQSLRTTYKAALELIKELDVTVAELLEACKDMVSCIEDCEKCEGTGVDPRCELDDACRGCGGVGKNLSSDGIFAALKAQEVITKEKR